MKAVISTAQGIENVKVLEVPNPPTPTGDQVQVAIKAVSINQRDIINFENYSRWNRENPIPGCDGASEVIAVGENVTKWKVSYGPFRRKSCYYYWCWSGPWRRCSACNGSRRCLSCTLGSDRVTGRSLMVDGGSGYTL